MKTIHKAIKKIAVVLICIGILLSSAETMRLYSVAATEPGYYKATSVLNLRSGSSSTSSPIYTDATNTVAVQVPMDTHLIVTQIANGYGLTCYQGFDGWVSLSYCEFIRGLVLPTDGNSAIMDISQFQNPAHFNWSKIKNAGITGVIIRLGGRYAISAGTGAIYEDSNWRSHYNAAKAAGMNVGFYFFSYAMTREGAVEEAEFCLNLIRNNGLEADLPIFFDLEDYDTDPQKPHYYGGKTLNNMLVNSFCSTIENAGYYAGVYTNYNFITTVLDPAVLTNRSFWYAQYNTEVSYTGRYDIWQYTSVGTVDGYSISSALDLNYCYRDYPAFIKQYGFNGFEGKQSSDKDGHTHIYSSPEIIQESTCSSDGLLNIACSTCGELLESDIIAKINHENTQVFIPNNTFIFSYDDEFSLTPGQYYDLSTENSILSAYTAIQSTGGTLVSFCINCNKIQSVQYFDGVNSCTHELDMTPAVYTANSTMNIRKGPGKTFSATTNDAGTTLYVPAGDNYNVFYILGQWGYAEYNGYIGWVNLEYSTLLTHAQYYNTSILQEPTCEKDGLCSASCVLCNEIAYKSTVRAEEHIGDSPSVIDGTCLTNGNSTIHCLFCDKLIRFEITNLGKHMYSRTVHTYPTDYSLGSATYKCNVCSESRYVMLRSLYMYDAVGSTGCDSADARIALRCSVGLEDISYRYLHRLDVNYDDKLTADDARTLLRICVGLEDEYELLFKYFEVKERTF